VTIGPEAPRRGFTGRQEKTISPASEVRVMAAVLDDLATHARRDAPRECCGLLLGLHRQIEVAWAAVNLSTDPQRRYLVDPADHFAAIRRARALGLEVIGAYHSHPEGPQGPSPTDVAEAPGASWIHLIVSLREPEPPQVRAFFIVEGNIRESRLVPTA
jgi:proteasome lid subunit RPN8/RPN11